MASRHLFWLTSLLPPRAGEGMDARGQPRGTAYYGWVLMVVLGITTIMSYGTTQYLFGVLVVPLDATFHWGRASISGTYSLGLIIAGLLGVPIGYLVDQRGARLLMSSGSALAGLALIGLAHVEAIWQFYLLWSGGLGLAMALTLYPVTFTIVASWFVRKRGAALAVLTLVGGLSSPICIPLAGTLVAHVGWRATLVVLGLSQLAIALPLHAFLLRQHPEDLGLSPDGEPALPVQAHAPLPGATLWEAIGSLVFWILTASLALEMLGSTVVFVHQVAFMISRGTDAVLAATLSGMLGLASLPGRYVFNMLSSRISAQKLLMLSVVAQAMGIVVLVQASSLSWLILYVAIYGCAYGAFSPLRASVMADHFGRRGLWRHHRGAGDPFGAVCWTRTAGRWLALRRAAPLRGGFLAVRRRIPAGCHRHCRNTPTPETSRSPWGSARSDRRRREGEPGPESRAVIP